MSASLQLLLFVDDRASSQENIQEIQAYLQSKAYHYDLQVIEIAEQPHLVEHFRLVATPALVKIHPEPRQTLAGSNLIAQLNKWWSHWQPSIQTKEEHQESLPVPEIDRNRVNHAAEIMRLSDEIFSLKQEKEELLEQLQFKDRVLAMLAHDLRSPLTAAFLAVETLELAQEQDGECAERLRKQLYQQARQQFRIANQMIADLLQASKSTNAQLQVEPEPLDLKFLCQEIVPQFTRQFQEKLQVFEQDIPQDLPAVFADRELIRQVIINLLENALKYTPEKGEIKLSILHRTTQKVQISICDTGPGIPEEKQERIFEGHFRLQRDESHEGYGLGLSVCRRVIRLHYGQIWVDSSPDQGSCFHFTLPIYR